MASGVRAVNVLWGWTTQGQLSRKKTETEVKIISLVLLEISINSPTYPCTASSSAVVIRINWGLKKNPSARAAPIAMRPEISAGGPQLQNQSVLKASQ